CVRRPGNCCWQSIRLEGRAYRCRRPAREDLRCESSLHTGRPLSVFPGCGAHSPRKSLGCPEVLQASEAGTAEIAAFSRVRTDPARVSGLAVPRGHRLTYRFFYKPVGNIVWVAAACHGAQIPEAPDENGSDKE